MLPSCLTPNVLFPRAPHFKYFLPFTKGENKRGVQNYVGTRPLSFTPGKDENSVARRQCFAMAIRLSHPINSIYQLKSLWNTVTSAGLSPYKMIVKANYINVQLASVSDLVKLVPNIGFSVQIDNIRVDENHLRVTIAGLTSNTFSNS